MVTWEDIKNYKVKDDFKCEPYENYLYLGTLEEKKKDIVSCIKRCVSFHPNCKQDICINQHNELAFLSPFTSDCKKYLYSVTSQEIWDVVEELKRKNDGYHFLLFEHGYIQYAKDHNGIWY